MKKDNGADRQETTGIVLRLYNAGQRDKIGVFYTRDFGLIKVYLPQGRLFGKKNVGILQPFNVVALSGAWQDTLFMLYQAELVRSVPLAALGLKGFVYTSLLVEMLEIIFPEVEKDDAVYEVLFRYGELAAKKDIVILTVIAGWQLVALGGYQPEVGQVEVRKYYSGAAERYWFGNENPVPAEIGQPVILPEELCALWKRIFQYNWQLEQTMTIKKKQIKLLEVLLYDYVEQYTDRSLKSRASLSIVEDIN